MAAVCCLIPDSIEGLDLDSYGYHRQCYQRFHLNLNRLKGYGASDQVTTSERHHSPRKHSFFEGGDIYITTFPPDWIFCDKVERKVHGKTERSVKFISWWHKKSAWQQIEHQALALRHFGLYRVKIFMLLKHCRDKFRREYQSHIRGMERADNRTLNTEQACQAAAHREAFNAVVEMIKKQVIKKN